MRLGRLAGSLLLVSLALGVGSAGGGGLATTSVLIEVIGSGKVTGPGVDCGRGAHTCYATFSSSGTVTVTATSPLAGWSFSSWGGSTGDTDCNGSGAAGCTINLDGAAHQVTANFATGSAVATRTLTATVPLNTGGKIAGGNIKCGSPSPPPPDPNNACNWTVLDGSTLTVVESPDVGYLFTGWGSDCIGTDKSCTVSMTQDSSVTATFSVSSTPRTLTVTVVGGGSVSGGGINCPAGSTCSNSEPVGSYITLDAHPSEGSNFGSWSGDCTGTSPSCTVQMTADRRVTATFELTYPLAVSVIGNGTVTGGPINCGAGGSVCSANLAANSSVTLTATPTGIATFTGWSGACAGAVTTCTVTMSAAKSVTATFSGTTPPPAVTYVLTVSVTGSGAVTGTGINCGNGGRACSASVTAGATLTLVASPASGATFSGWSGPCAETSTSCTFAMTGPTGVGATFVGGGSTTYPLSLSVKGSGKVTGHLILCGTTFTVCFANEPASSTVALTATPLAGATFQSWGGACAGIAKTCQVLMNSAKTVSAQFSAPPPKATLTLKVVGKGSVVAPAGSCAGGRLPRTCTQTYSRGRQVTLTARPAKHKVFRGWSGACIGKTPACTVLLTRSRSVTATFSA